LRDRLLYLLRPYTQSIAHRGEDVNRKRPHSQDAAKGLSRAGLAEDR